MNQSSIFKKADKHPFSHQFCAGDKKSLNKKTRIILIAHTPNKQAQKNVCWWETKPKPHFHNCLLLLLLLLLLLQSKKDTTIAWYHKNWRSVEIKRYNEKWVIIFLISSTEGSENWFPKMRGMIRGVTFLENVEYPFKPTGPFHDSEKSYKQKCAVEVPWMPNTKWKHVMKSFSLGATF